MAGIGELMVTEMVTATPYETVAEVARRMARNRVGAILLVDKGDLWGLFSERDLLTRVVQENHDPNSIDVGAVATRNPVTVDIDAPVKQVLQIFREGKFRHLPVMENGKVLALVSSGDLTHWLVKDQFVHVREAGELAAKA